MAEDLGKIIGFWKLEKSENFDEYMKAVEVGYLMRKMGSVAKPNVKIFMEGNEIMIKSESTIKTHVTKFKLNEEFQDETPDGRKAKTKFELVDGKLIQHQIEGVVPSTISRYVDEDDNLIVVCEAKGVKSTRTYHRIKE